MAKPENEGLSIAYRIGWKIRAGMWHLFGPAQTMAFGDFLNDLEMMAVAFPTLSSIRTPRYAIGQRAVQLLQERLADKKVDTITDLGFELRPRESTNRIV